MKRPPQLRLQRANEQSGDRPSGVAVTRNGGGGKVFVGPGEDEAGLHGYARSPRPDSGYTDGGGAARFFFCSKASTAERELGCEHLPLHSAADMTGGKEGQARLDSPRAGAGRGDGAHNFHPTIKAVALTRWLATLILPPAGRPQGARRLLVPFAGSGSEMIGARRAGWDQVVGIEQDEAFVAIARARIARWEEIPAHVDPLASKPAPVAPAQVPLFGKGAA